MVKTKTMRKRYDATFNSVQMWAQQELEHVGRIVSIKDKDVQYSYALSTVNGMLHLKQAIQELIDSRPECKGRQTNLLILHGQVCRTIDHLIKDFNVNLDTIKNFNTRHVLTDLHTTKSKSKSKTKSKSKSKTRRVHFRV